MNIKHNPTASQNGRNAYAKGLFSFYLSDFQNKFQSTQKEAGGNSIVWKDKVIVRTRLGYDTDIEMDRQGFYNIISIINMLRALMEKVYNMQKQMSDANRMMQREK